MAKKAKSPQNIRRLKLSFKPQILSTVLVIWRFIISGIEVGNKCKISTQYLQIGHKTQGHGV